MLGSRVGLVLGAGRSDARALPGGPGGRRRRASNPATRSSRSKACQCRKVVPLDPTARGRSRPCDRHRLCAVLADPRREVTADRPRPDVAVASRANSAISRCTPASSISSRLHARSWPYARRSSSVVDLFHVLTYPFLLFAAWILHRRKREDLISSVLSLAVLLTMGSGAAVSDLPQLHRAHSAYRGIGTSTILATSACSPASSCSRSASCDRASCMPFLCLLPLLFFLHGDIYRVNFVIFMIAGVMTLLVRLRRTPPSAARQQIKWALFGFSGYSLFLSIALTCDMTKLTVGSFGAQLTLEVLAGLTLRPRLPLPAAGTADRADALSPVRCRSRHQPFGQRRPDHFRSRRCVRRPPPTR